MMRILVVEDEKLLCDGIAEDLELEKYTVERCYDGAEAYELLLTLARIPAPSNQEERRARFCSEWLKAQGAEGG